MAVYISIVSGAPDFAALPAAKIIRYPLEKRDYRPFAQAQFALSEGALTARLTAFEARPEERSALMLVLEGGQGGGAARAAWCKAPPGGQAAGPCPPEGDGLPGCEATYLRGEDLQGKYWGVELCIPRGGLEKSLGRALAGGGVLRGNVYKICGGGERDHFGSLFDSRPVWNAGDASALSAADLGEIRIAGY